MSEDARNALSAGLYRHLCRGLAGTPLESWAGRLTTVPDAVPLSHGDNERWHRALAAMPDLRPGTVVLDEDTVRIGSATDIGADQRLTLEASLREMMPWRKGPFDFFGIHIDTEWRSDWKWQRLEDHIDSLVGRRVLDVGCGSGYHCWRVLGAGADFVLGIDPTLLFAWQFRAAQRYLEDRPVAYVPTALERLPTESRCFDTVFSMGVLYHRRSPLDHLAELRGCLRNGGQLVLETLIVDGDEGHYLMPEHRYAQMRNVWFIPSVAGLIRWLNRSGFSHARCVDISTTTVAEQRSTDWMRYQSLADALDRYRPSRTVEGYPAPKRAMLVALAA